MLLGKVHVDLLKLQADYASNDSYRKSQNKLNAIMGKRTINNHMQIRSVANKVGKILASSNDKMYTPSKINNEDIADELCAVVDGGHVHDANNPGHNFEVMAGKIFNPDNLVRVDKHHTKITQKECASSTKYDKQETMKTYMAVAAQNEGVDKTRTVVTALADGAKNCWNILESLRPLCFVLKCILDWFHIGKYIQRVKKSIPYYEVELDEIKNVLWVGNTGFALNQLKLLENKTQDDKHAKIINNFYNYIKENEAYIVNYSERQKQGLIYTSHIAESTVEHLLNERSRRKQKMQWSREGLHNVMQIRASQASGRWDSDWKDIIQPALSLSA